MLGGGGNLPPPTEWWPCATLAVAYDMFLGFGSPVPVVVLVAGEVVCVCVCVLGGRGGTQTNVSKRDSLTPVCTNEDFKQGPCFGVNPRLYRSPTLSPFQQSLQ